MKAGGWSIDERDGLVLVRSELLSGLPGVRHAFSTLKGPGGERFDLGGHDAGAPEVEARRRSLVDAAGLGGRTATILEQVHGDRVLRAEELAPADGPLRADGVVALRETVRGLAPAVRWADCVPILLAEEEGRAVAAVHSGWRGTAAGIAAVAVELLSEMDIRRESLRAALGPAIGPCCYTVGAEVSSALPAAAAGSGPGADLRRAVRWQLESAGLAPGSISAAPWCTACEAALFFSHRREGLAAGRQMACIGWAAAA